MKDSKGKNSFAGKDKNNSQSNNEQYSLVNSSTLAQSKPFDQTSINKLKNSSIEEVIKSEDKIDKRIRVLQKTKPSLSYLELRKISEKDLKIPKYKDSLDLQNNVIILINIKAIRKAKQEEIEKKVSEIKDSKMSINEKYLKVLNDMNSSETFEYVENNKAQIKGQESSTFGNPLAQEKKNLENLEKFIPPASKDKNYSEDSTNDLTGRSTRSETGIEIKHDFWIKNKYYDLSEYSAEKKGIKRQMLKDKDKEKMAFIYQNDLSTYYFTISQNLADVYEIKTITPKEKKDLDKENGLYFCGKKIEQFNKICRANEMMCKDCMKKNKEIYHLDRHKHVLININGRMCTNSFSDRNFRCYGKFIVNKEIKNCIIGEFTCKACHELNRQKKYYSSE